MVFCKLKPAISIGVDVGLVIPVVGEGRVDLAEGEVGILKMQLGWTPAVGEMGGDQLNDFHGCSGDVRNVILAEGDVFVVSRFNHDFTITPCYGQSLYFNPFV